MINYEQHVKPILSKCFSCHGQTQQQSGLRLDLRQNALRGGDYGAVIVPGKSAESKLIHRVAGSNAGLQMPPTGALSPDEVGILRAWNDQGAEMPGRATDSATIAKVTDPRFQDVIDIIHRQDAAGLRRALAADRFLARQSDGAGSTALMHAAYAGTLDMMQALLDAGADVNAGNDRKATALHWAVADTVKLKLLLSKGADLNAKTVEGRTVLHLAAARPDGVSIVQLLIEGGADINARNLTGQTPLFAAVTASADSVRLLLDKGANPNAKSDTNATPLMGAAANNPAAVVLLVGRGADVTFPTKRGETPLANAANHGDLASARLLIEKGANVNAVDYRGYTPLMQAAYADDGPVELVRLLLAHGANINATGEGETPLSLAAKRGETETTRVLREAQTRPQSATVAGTR